jgi:type II secretory pathway pseudopilin PulG
LAKSRFSNAAGFSLIETVVATSLLATALVTVAQLFAMATSSNLSARDTSFATMLAEQKMEQLRSLTWGFDAVGLPLSDLTTNTAVSPEEPTTGKGLSPSPADALKANTAGYYDFVDRWGNVVSENDQGAQSPMYFRRWSIEPLPTNPNNTLILTVLVTPTTKEALRAAAAPSGTRTRLVEDALLTTVRTRKAP